MAKYIKGNTFTKNEIRSIINVFHEGKRRMIEYEILKQGKTTQKITTYENFSAWATNSEIETEFDRTVKRLKEHSVLE